MNKPLIINGSEFIRTPFTVASPFYPGSTHQIASASVLDIASAIGSARSADRETITTRTAYLHKAAQGFTYSQQTLEHAVHMTGMPIRYVEELFKQIPEIFKELPSSQSTRFHISRGDKPYMVEPLGAGRFKVLQAIDGFCYAVAPGNDPRATALVAANLTFWGIPFILRASPRDAAAPLVIQSLLQSGIDPKFCSLIYLDPGSSETPEKHFKLVDASDSVWTFGPAHAIDPTLRFKSSGQRWVADLEDLIEAEGSSKAAEDNLPGPESEAVLTGLKKEDVLHDHFQGKTILRHEAGNCAALAWGALDADRLEILSRSSGYAIICTAVKSLLAIDSPGCLEQLATFVPELRTGDPLDPATQVGYIQSRHLDRLEALVNTNRGRARFYGGKRLSPVQSEPLLAVSEGDIPAFFGQEIQAYVLAAANCRSLKEAATWLNRHQNPPRLAVTLLNSPQESRLDALHMLKCHTLLIDKPTSIISAVLHEGNDYGLVLSNGRLLVI
jgi:acyl-CoA reductase-like NAD-dependent aldehyde dehydrogenase